MVAISPRFEAKYNLDSFSYEDVLDYMAKHRTTLLHGYFVGAWVNEGVVYLDISEKIRTLDKAIERGINRKQLAIFDNKNKVEIGNLPKPQTTGTHYQRNAHTRDLVTMYLKDM